MICQTSIEISSQSQTSIDFRTTFLAENYRKNMKFELNGTLRGAFAAKLGPYAVKNTQVTIMRSVLSQIYVLRVF